MHAKQAYRKVAIQTSDPREIVVMLYDGFLRFGFRARAHLSRNQCADASQAVGRAMSIVHELMQALDHSPTPQLSQQLESLYMYVSDRLLRVSLHQDMDALDEVIDLMTDLRGAWAQALEQLRQQDAFAAAPAR